MKIVNSLMILSSIKIFSVNISKWQSKNLKIFSSIKVVRTLARIVKINFFRILKIKGLQDLLRIYARKMAESVNTANSGVFSLLYFNLPSP